MKRRTRFAWLAGVPLTLAVAVASWAAFLRPDAGQCYACQRPIHAHSRTLGTAAGRARTFCCPACALSLHEQTGKPVTLTAMTSFLTGQTVPPEKAYIVEGSNVTLCPIAREIVGSDKRAADLRYDRCCPSLVAFGSRDEAELFRREHGGKVKPFLDIAAAYRK